MWLTLLGASGHVRRYRCVLASLIVLAGIASVVLAVPTSATVPDSTDHDRVVARAREHAELEMGKVSAPTQATVLLGLGRSYSRVDKKKSVGFLERAYDLALRLNEVEAPGIGVVQNDAVTELARVAPEHVEQNMPVDPQLRDAAVTQLIRRDAKNQNFDHAIELLQTMNDPDWVAQDLLMALRDNDERNQVFGIVLESYGRRGVVAPGRGTDMGTLLVRFWRDLHPELVNEAADELLKEAGPDGGGTRRESKLAITASSPAGSIVFKNYYEFRLFQLLPILKVTDPVRADALLRDDQQLKALFAKYPEGQQSFDPTMRDTPLKEGETSKVSYSIVRGSTGAQSAAARIGENQVVNAIYKSSGDDPQQALESARAIRDPQIRVRALIAVAEQTVTVDPATARSALRAVLDASTAPFVQVAKLFLQLKDLDDAKSSVERGMAVADRTYKEDANPDDPNQAIRLLWPSVQNWRDLIDIANTISPDFAVELVDGLPDAEAKPLERTFLAGRWLGITPWASTSPFVMHKPKQ